MRASFILSAIAFAASASAAAVTKRAPETNIDATVLNFALILEHLEDTFYRQGLSNYSASAFTSAGYTSAVRDNLMTIAADEASHVALLTGALSAAGATPAQACTYNFGVNTPQGFLAVATVLEGVGVSAYSGAAPLITSPDYLEVAANILTVEARHSAFIRLVNGKSPFPADLDTGITPTAVTTLAAPFFASCPSGSAPPFMPFPSLAVTNAANATQGSTLAIQANTTLAAQGATLYCAFASGGATYFSSYANNACQVPSNVTNGQTYVYLTNGNSRIADNTTISGPAILDFGAANQTVFSTSGSSGANGTSSGSQSQTTTAKGAATALLPKAGALAGVLALAATLL